MKKILLLLLTVFCVQTAQAADLLEVYQQALISDPIYQQAISQRLATKEGVPISLSALLPNIGLTWFPNVTRSGFSGTDYATGSNPRNNTLRYYALTLTATQTVFNFSQFMTLKSSLALSAGADAILNSALQTLMMRVSNAYFAVLRDEENLSYSEATMLAYKEQLDQVNQEYKVGIKTITNVYTAQASYDSAVADYIGAENTLINDKENLRVITGRYYEHLSPLSENFPLISPNPRNVEEWVKTALQQNWQIKSAQYNVSSARSIVKQQFGGHLPTVQLQASADRLYSDNVNNYAQALNQRNGPSTESDRVLQLNMTLPIFSGGGVTAETNQAMYNYEIAQQQLEQTQRLAVNSTRQSYFGVISGISKVKADREAVKSTISSLEGMEESYQVGTETLVNVLNQQQKVFEAQTQYATDRYAFVTNFLALKQAAGTLGFDDLRAINAWLLESATAERRKVRKFSVRHHNSLTKDEEPAKPAHSSTKKTAKDKNLKEAASKKKQLRNKLTKPRIVV